MTRKFLERVNPPTWLRRALGSWQFWITLCVLGLIWACVLGFKALERIAKDENGRQQAQYASCVLALPEYKSLDRHVRGINALATIQVENAKRIRDATPEADPQRKVRTKVYEDLKRAAADVHAARRLAVPTRAQCLEQSLHPPKLPQEKTRK